MLVCFIWLCGGCVLPVLVGILLFELKADVKLFFKLCEPAVDTPVGHDAAYRDKADEQSCHWVSCVTDPFY
jgi:hypothetical protein